MSKPQEDMRTAKTSSACELKAEKFTFHGFKSAKRKGGCLPSFGSSGGRSTPPQAGSALIFRVVGSSAIPFAVTSIPHVDPVVQNALIGAMPDDASNSKSVNPLMQCGICQRAGRKL